MSSKDLYKSFNIVANNFIRVKAINVIYIKKLSNVLKDYNSIKAIIRNIEVNSDDRSQGLVTLNNKAHESLIRKIYVDSNLISIKTNFVKVRI